LLTTTYRLIHQNKEIKAKQTYLSFPLPNRPTENSSYVRNNFALVCAGIERNACVKFDVEICCASIFSRIADNAASRHTPEEYIEIYELSTRK
jgi:hypothetical protein